MNTPNSHDGNAPEARTGGETGADPRDAEPLTSVRVGENLRRAIKAAGLTQAAVAEQAEIDPTALSKILAGKRKVSSLELALICTATGSDVLGILEADPLHGPSYRRGLDEGWDRAEAERDRARNLAASLEQECARLSETVARVEALREEIRAEQNRCCAYGTTHGDGRTCDCKFPFPGRTSSEASGCPERRRFIDQIDRALTGPTETGDEPA